MIMNCEYFLALCIGVVLMTEMGQLAINIYQSVREYLNMADHRKLCCSQFSPECQTRTVYSISVTALLIGIGYFVVATVELSKWEGFSNPNRDNLFDRRKDYVRVFGIFTLFLSIPFFVILTGYYVWLRNVLSICMND